MKKLWPVLLVAALGIFVIACATANTNKDDVEFYTSIEGTENYEIPKCVVARANTEKIPHSDSHQIVRHAGYTLCYREKFEQAEWVAYTLDAEKLQKNASRQNDFRPDPLVKTYSAQNDDYRKSGYDRGHLAPAADMAYSQIAMSESFFFSNMTPQDHDFNAGIWNDLEQYLRNVARKNEKLFIATGPILEKDDYPTIGANNVAVPEFFYKVVLIKNSENLKMLAFIIPNEPCKEKFWKFKTTVDEVERRTGIDFFYLLADELENELEKN